MKRILSSVVVASIAFSSLAFANQVTVNNQTGFVLHRYGSNICKATIKPDPIPSKGQSVIVFPDGRICQLGFGIKSDSPVVGISQRSDGTILCTSYRYQCAVQGNTVTIKE